jgi:GxxExxY protein
MKTINSKLIHEEKTYAILGACFEVYNQQGCGFNEPVYQESLEIELALRDIPFVAQPEMRLAYKGRPLKATFRPDFICFGNIILEIKAVSSLVEAHDAQVLGYLSATGHELGLLVNFGGFPKVEYKRLLLSEKRRIQSTNIQDITL